VRLMTSVRHPPERGREKKKGKKGEKRALDDFAAHRLQRWEKKKRNPKKKRRKNRSVDRTITSAGEGGKKKERKKGKKETGPEVVSYYADPMSCRRPGEGKGEEGGEEGEKEKGEDVGHSHLLYALPRKKGGKSGGEKEGEE